MCFIPTWIPFSGLCKFENARKSCLQCVSILNLHYVYAILNICHLFYSHLISMKYFVESKIKVKKTYLKEEIASLYNILYGITTKYLTSCMFGFSEIVLLLFAKFNGYFMFIVNNIMYRWDIVVNKSNKSRT